MFESSNAGVRDAANSLTLEIYRWCGKPLLAKTMEGLRTAQVGQR
jgi:hypothetical protein